MKKTENLLQGNELSQKRSSPWNFIVFLSMVFVPVLFGVYAVTLGQDMNWDLMNYHLYNPYAYINDRIHFDLAPAGLQTYFNPLLDLVYFASISTLSPKAVAFLIGLIQGLSFIFIYKIAIQILGKKRYGYAIFLGIAGLLSSGFLSEVGTTFHDSLIGVLSLSSLWLTMSVIGMATSDQFKSRMSLIGISGLLIGVATGLKLTFAIYMLALLIGLFVSAPRNYRFKLVLFFGVSAFLGWLIINGYWFYKMWNEFGNPLFPQFNNIFHGELAASESARDTRFLPKNLYEKFFYPLIFTINPTRVAEFPYKQVSWVFGYVALLALMSAMIFRAMGAVIFRAMSAVKFKTTRINPIGNFNPQLLLLLSYFGVAYLLWLNIFGIYRYLIPLEVLIPILVFVAIDYLFKLHIRRWVGLIFISSIILFNLRGVPDWGHSDWSETVYDIESSSLDTLSDPVVVYLAGQPLAWIIPALDINVPFIQLVPNMPVTEAYWMRARDLAGNRKGTQFIIFESLEPDLFSRAQLSLSRLGLTIDQSSFKQLIGYLGTARREYTVYEVNSVHPLKYDVTLSFSHADSNQYYIHNLSGQENWGRWSDGSQAEITFYTTPNSKPKSVAFNLKAFVTSNNPEQKASVFINDESVGDIQISAGEAQPKQFIFALPNAEGNKYTIRFEIDKPTTPKSVGANEDIRELGFGFISMKLLQNEVIAQ